MMVGVDLFVFVALLAAALALVGLWGRVRGARSRLWLAATLAVGASSVWAAMSIVDLPHVGAGLVLVLALGLYPALAVSAMGSESEERAQRSLLFVLTALLFLVVASCVQRTLALGDTLVLQAIDQVGEIRLAGIRQGSGVGPDSFALHLQLFLVFPFFLPFKPLFSSEFPLLWGVGLFPVVQALWLLPAGVVAWKAFPRRSQAAGAFVVIALAVAVHPAVMDKTSWDFTPPGTLLFVLAYLFERRGRRWPFVAALVLGAWCHPLQAVMAALWGADHARRNWSTTTSAERKRLLAVPVLVWLLAVVPVGTLVLTSLASSGPSLIQQLAPYSRDELVWRLGEGDWPWLFSMVGMNFWKLLLLLLPLGFLPVLRFNRFLVYASVELLYSLGTPNGFFHGSLPGFVGLLACAAIDNSHRLRPSTLKMSGRVAALVLLPLMVLWSDRNFAVEMLRTEQAQRADAVAQMIRAGDEERTCVGQMSTYPAFAGHCAREGVLRFVDGLAALDVRAAEVYFLSLEPSRRSLWWGGIRKWLSRLPARWSDRQPLRRGRHLDFDEEPVAEDLRWLQQEIRSGDLRVTSWKNGYLRLDRRADDADETTAWRQEVLDHFGRRIDRGERP